MRRLVTFIFFLAGLSLNAQVPYLAGSKSYAMGESSLLQENVWAVHDDPSSMTGIKHFTTGIWTVRRFNMRELSNGAVAVALPVKQIKRMVIGAGIFVYGFTPTLNQQKFNLSVALGLSEKLSAGVGLHLLRTQFIEPYGNELTPIGELALHYKFNNNTTAGIRLWNLAPAKMADWQNEHLPTVIIFGLRQKVSGPVSLQGEVSHETSGPTALHFAIDYKPNKKISFQAGFRTSPAAYGFGISFRFTNLDVHLGFLVQQVLGISPGVTFTYEQPDAK
jgi:hypothetical protein